MAKKSKGVRATDKTDAIIGTAIRRIRLAKGMTQTELGNEIGVTFQQVQKIEKGVNRIAASRLFRASKALKVSVDQFFEGA